MNSKQLLGTIVLFAVTIFVFPAIISFIITGLWASWVVFSNADGLATEDKKYDQNAPILSTKINSSSPSQTEETASEQVVYGALEERKALLRKDIM